MQSLVLARRCGAARQRLLQGGALTASFLLAPEVRAWGFSCNVHVVPNMRACRPKARREPWRSGITWRRQLTVSGSMPCAPNDFAAPAAHSALRPALFLPKLLGRLPGFGGTQQWLTALMGRQNATPILTLSIPGTPTRRSGAGRRLGSAAAAAQGGPCSKLAARHQSRRGEGGKRRYGRGGVNDFWDPNTMYVIIGANVAVWVLWQNHNLRRFLADHFAVSTYGVLSELRVHTLFTSIISQPNFGLLLGNCITLWFFGSECLAILGTRRFLQLYVFGGAVSSAVAVVWPLLAPRHHGLNVHSLSFPATGAVNAVVMYSILTFPQRTILLYFFLPVPAALLGGLFVAKDAYALTTGDRAYGSAGNLAGSALGTYLFYAWRRARFRF